jgi:hypothetical protein
MLTNTVLAIVFANSVTALPIVAGQKLMLDFWQMQLREIERPKAADRTERPGLSQIPP